MSVITHREFAIHNEGKVIRTSVATAVLVAAAVVALAAVVFRTGLRSIGLRRSTFLRSFAGCFDWNRQDFVVQKT